MKNIQDIAKITCEIYSSDDLANGWEFMSVVEHIDEIKEYFEHFDFTIPYTVDTIIDYFVVDKICSWSFLDRVTLEYKDKYNQIKTYFGNIKSKYEARKIIEFVKSFSFMLDDEIEHGFTFRLYNLLPQFANSIKDENVFIKAINARPYLVLDRLDSYKKVFKLHNCLYASLFSEDNIQKFLEYRFEKFAVEASKICRSDGCIDVLLKEALISKFVALADAIIDNTDVKQALVNQIRYKTILKFLNAVAYPKYADYLSKQKQVDALADKWLEKNGHEYSYEIPFDDIKEQLDNPEIPFGVKYAQLSHSRRNIKWEHFCAAAMNIGRQSITDFITCSNIDTNEHFGATTQQIIGVYNNIHGYALQYLVRDFEKWEIFVRYTYGILSYIYANFSVPFEKHSVEYLAWANKGAEYLFSRNDDDLLKKDIAFIFTDKTIKLTEKVLRTVYMEEMNRQGRYYDPDKITLGTILKSEDQTNPLIDILSAELMQYISFCLIKDEDSHGNKVGISLRNLIEHDKCDWIDFEYGNGVLALLVFISVLNALYIYYSIKK